MATSTVREIPIAEIKVTGRFRKDMGDLKSLAASIEELGLLQPIAVTPSNRLLFGERRLKACKILKWKEIPATVLDIERYATIEDAENTERKEFTHSEKVAIAAAKEEEIGDRQGQRTDQQESDPSHVAETPQVEPGQKTRDVAAENAGFSSTFEYRSAQTVVSKAIPEVVEAMDNKTIPVSTAAKVAELDPDKQKQVMEKVAAGVKPSKALAELNGHKPKKSSPPKPKPAAPDKPPVSEEPPTPTDDMKRVNEEIEGFCRNLMAFVNEHLPRDEWLRGIENKREGALRKFKDGCELLRTAKCRGLCPKCKSGKTEKGRNCEVCHGTGRLPKLLLDSVGS